MTTLSSRDNQPIAQSKTRSEEHTSELQSRLHLVCRLLLEKKKRHDEGRGPQDHGPLHQRRGEALLELRVRDLLLSLLDPEPPRHTGRVRPVVAGAPR